MIKNFREATQSFPHCVTFQVRLTAFILEKQLKNWECNNIFMNYLPNSFNNNRDLGINNLKDHFIYYSKSLLIPEATHSVKFTTSNQYYFLKMSYEQNLKEFELDIKLKQGGKVLKTAKPFKHKTLQSTQSYLTYLLKPNREYELEFNNISDHVDHPNPEVAKFHSYFENCKLVEFHLEFTSKNFLESTRNPRKCEMIIPKIEEVFYERLVGVPNSFFRYGDRRKMWGLRRDDPKEKSEDFDLETKNNKIFQFQKTQKPFKHSYQFEIHYLVSRLSAKIEINFDTSLMIYVSRRTESNTAVIASGEITGLNTVELKPISLEGGKYELTIIETNYNKNINKNMYNLNESNWKEKYYYSLFNKRTGYEFIQDVCKSYIRGLNFIYGYYFKRIPVDYTFYYPYLYSPTFRDLSNYFEVISQDNNIVSKDEYIQLMGKKTQLMIVLPLSSMVKIDNVMYKYIINLENECRHFYPDEFKISTFLKQYIWECYPVLPDINIHTLSNASNASNAF